MKKSRIRLSDIASEAGVSTMAVSHVLNGSGKGKVSVSPQLSEHIKNVAIRLNYHPHQAAKALRGSLIRVIGAVTFDSMDPIKTRALSCLETAASKKGYHIMTSRISPEINDWKTSVTTLLSHGVSGLLAFCDSTEQAEQALSLGEEEGVTVIPIRLDGGHLPDSSSGIRTDVAKGIQLALNSLDGQKQIIVVQYMDNEFTKIVNKTWPSIRIENISNFTLQAEDQILCDSDWTAAQIIRAHQPLIPGNDYKIVGWGNAPACEYMTPSLTSIGLNLPEVVTAAVNSLTDLNTIMIHSINPIILKRKTTT